MNDARRSPLLKFFEQILPRMKYPYLFLILLGLFAANVIIPDPIPFVDEAMLLVLTLLVGSWGKRGEAPPEDQRSAQPKDVTDRGRDF